MKINQDVLRQVLTLTSVLAAFGTNVISNISPIGGLSIGEISNTILKDVLITPASYAFAIWGLIYLGLISFAIYQALPAQRQNPRLLKLNYLLVVSSLAQIVWVLVFQLQLFSLSLLAMLVILLPLIVIYLRLKKERFSKQERWLIEIPLTIYFAWISVATIVNVAIVLYVWGWNGWGISPQIWTAIALLLGTTVATIISIRYSDIAYVGVFVWALIAIALRHLNTISIAATASISAIALILLLIFNLLRRRRLNFQ